MEALLTRLLPNVDWTEIGQAGFDTLNIQAVDVLTAAEYAWKQAAENVAISGLEMRSNSGENRIINFTKAKIKNRAAIADATVAGLERQRQAEQLQQTVAFFSVGGEAPKVRNRHEIGQIGRASCRERVSSPV